MDKELELLAREYMEFEGQEVPERLSENYIIDEDKSVRWNREEIKRYNENRKAIILENRRQKNKIYEAWKQKVIEQIMKEDFSVKQANLIYDFAMDLAGIIGDSSLSGIYDEAIHTVTFINELKKEG